MNFKKILLLILILCSVVILCYIIYQRVTLGERTEREELLEAVVWTLQEEGYSSNDIEDITIEFEYFKGGVYPYNYKAHVLFKKDNSTEIIYSWKNNKKTKAIRGGYTAH